MILTDGIHLVSTESAEELHAFARRIGLARARYEGVRKGHPHYDLTRKAKARAILAGAVGVTSRELARRAWWSNKK